MLRSIQEQVLESFHYLHCHPEISWEEANTTNYIGQLLEKNGCKVVKFDDCTGVIGEYGKFDSDLPIVGIRADMDALWQEVDGTFQPNHSCGHDAHMSIVLGVLWKLQKTDSIKDKVAIKFIFQPAEENGTGALKMVEKNVIHNVDYLYGIHLRPVQETAPGRATPVIVHGATKMYDVEILGEDAHGARPHLNHNAIEVAAQILNMISQIHLDPRIPHSVKMTKIQAGGKNTNIIPGNGSFSLDLRAQNNELMDKLEVKVNDIFQSMRHLYDLDINVTHIDGIVAAVTNEEATDIMRKSIIETLGEENLDKPLVTPGGDDFHFYTVKKPTLKASMLGLGCNLSPGLHHPNMTFDKEYLMNGVDILYRAILNTYEKK
ncbi:MULTISPECIES: M20 peptidase aminoacylase family protein [Cytobacillus]|uniref:Amidohydrolase n=1 Tax=Cytobacillus kochii TaxID=859143 RepID=A0A248TP96_9BACI|nr:M20 peptidase aminoacylase family protein [Cytobacillus kochii]ASV70026.1 amidohydrolase [Cytobacillus kochii]